MRAPFTIGVTGKIAAGKSTFCAALRAHGVLVFDCDVAAKPIVAARFGALDASFFTDNKRYKTVTAYAWPRVQEAFLAWRLALKEPLCAVESAVLHAAKLDLLCDEIVEIQAEKPVREARSALSPAALNAREMRQKLLEKPTHLVANNGDKSALEVAANQLIERWLRMLKSAP